MRTFMVYCDNVLDGMATSDLTDDEAEPFNDHYQRTAWDVRHRERDND